MWCVKPEHILHEKAVGTAVLKKLNCGYSTFSFNIAGMAAPFSRLQNVKEVKKRFIFTQKNWPMKIIKTYFFCHL